MSSGGTPPVGLTPGDGGSSGGMFNTDRIGGFGYGVGVSVGILLLITTITLASYFCTRAPVDDADASPAAAHHPSRRHRHRHGGGNEGAHDDGDDVELGIDEATLKGYPEVVYGDGDVNRKEASKKKKEGTTCTCCSICLDNYGDGEVLRMLPECGHLFHRECVDPWLRHHPTCPVCRTSPVPSPMPTPLAEVTPLAMAARMPSS